jgi:hypothetical protein
MILPILPQRFNIYFQAFSDLPLRSKITRVALPTIVGLAGLGLSLALAYYLFKPAPARQRENPKPQLADGEIAPLILTEEQLSHAALSAVLDPQTAAHQLDLQNFFPQAVSHPYIIARTAVDFAQCSSFYKLAAEKAGLIISIGSSENFNFFNEGSMVAGPYLECIRGPIEVSAGCNSYQFNFKTLPPSASASLRNSKTLWHLNIDLSSKTTWLRDIHHAFDVIDQFIDHNKISFEGRSLIVSSRSRDDQASIFIVFHQLYHHFKKLAEKEIKDNPGMTDAELADKILKDIDITQLIEQRSQLIKKLSREQFEVEDPLVLHMQYRDNVLLQMIGQMRSSSNIPALPKTSPQPDAADLLKQLSGLDELVKVDPKQDWVSWNRVIPRLIECENKLYRTLSISSIDAKMKIWEYIDAHTPSLASCQNFYEAMNNAIEKVASYESTMCRLFRDFMGQKLEKQGYTRCYIATKSGDSELQCLSFTLLDVLVHWYRKDTAYAEKADRLGKILEELQGRQAIGPAAANQLEELLQPLRDLRCEIKNFEQFQLLKMIASAFENEPKTALKDYLYPVLNLMNDSYINRLLQEVTDLEGAVFLLLGQCLTNSVRAYQWLRVLYKAPIEKFGAGPIEGGPNILSPPLYPKVKEFLIQILSNEDYLQDLYKAFEGRIALSCMWLQVEAEVLLKAVPLLFKKGNSIDQYIMNSDLPDIWERFASDPVRIEHYPEACDLLLECAFKVKCLFFKPLEVQTWLRTSSWAYLQTNEKLPRLRMAYRQKAPADS